VIKLSYECHDSMALKKMQEICVDCT